jgi:hypothetical protein
MTYSLYLKKTIEREVGRAEDLSAPQYKFLHEFQTQTVHVGERRWIKSANDFSTFP